MILAVYRRLGGPGSFPCFCLCSTFRVPGMILIILQSGVQQGQTPGLDKQEYDGEKTADNHKETGEGRGYWSSQW